MTGGKARPRPLARAQKPIPSPEVSAHLAGLKAALRALEACLAKGQEARDKLKAEIAVVERGSLH